jgi:ketosteroid isomerase-like protein
MQPAGESLLFHRHVVSHDPIIHVRSLLAALPLLGMLLIVPVATPAQAQQVPGAPSTDWERARADYNTRILREYTAFINQWRETLNGGDVDRALALYSDNAMVLVAGNGAVQGRDSIRAFLSGTMPRIVEILTGLNDFAASENLAYAAGPLLYTYRTGESGLVHTVSGHHVTVLVREGRRWRIRSQVLRYEEPAAQPSG